MPYIGPTAPWADLEEVETVYPFIVQRAVDFLSGRLQARLSRLSSSDLEVILQEIRRQVAECAVDGHLTIASDLNDLCLELLTAREHSGNSGSTGPAPVETVPVGPPPGNELPVGVQVTGAPTKSG